MGAKYRHQKNHDHSEPVLLVEMRVKGHLKEWFDDYFGGLQLDYGEDGSCALTGKLQDSAAFYGLILALRDSGVELLYLEVKKYILNSEES